MKITLTNTLLAVLALTALLALTLYSFSFYARFAGASAPSGLQADVATSSVFAIAARTSSSLFATSSCAARIIQTGISPIMLTFSNYAGQSPTGTFGVLQAASTTVVYDSGQYGCGLVKGFSDVAQSLTLTESR